MRALIISTDGFEDSELLVPYYRLQEDGIPTDIASLAPGTISGKHHYKIEAGAAVKDIDPARYDLLVLPGGKAPSVLRNDPIVLSIVRHFFETAKPVAAICHGPQILVSAGVLKGRTATCYSSVASELKNADVNYKDAAVVVDGNLITSRQPADLPVFMRAIMQTIKEKAIAAAPR